ncbi:hypothetical protein CIG66_17055 [Ralstonia pseudosolanacearum]|uniref:hypothetical protein n=1 Tax=Ralstonia pseudosolanacearum TaxID=1310165 RepID=UPI000B9A16A5|nr:hypothetical protein CIG66_17055 [Ralstonia pseudosolanacearum]
MKRLAGITQGPVAAELLAGLRRIRAEWQRLRLRVGVQRQLRQLDREEFHAVRDVEWQQEELARAEGNLARLQAMYAGRRRVLHRRLRETNPDFVERGNAAA